MTPLGQKIKFFRKRAKVSQFELEGKIGASAGSLSRIESGEVNPTKETLEKIKKALNLTYIETLFLDGEYAETLTWDTVKIFLGEVDYILNNHGEFAYVLDERYRIWAVSKGLFKLLKITEADWVNYRGRNILEVMFDKESPVQLYFDKKSKYQMSILQVARVRQLLGLSEIDEYIENLFKHLIKIQEFKKVWSAVCKKDWDTFTTNSHKVDFLVKGKKIELFFHMEHLEFQPRLILIIFKPTNLLLKFLSKL